MQTTVATYNTHFDGEVFLEERNNTWNMPFLFNGKELDEDEYETFNVGNRAYYQQSPYHSALTSGNTFIQINRDGGRLGRANISGGFNPMHSQNLIHDNFPGGAIPRFYPR